MVWPSGGVIVAVMGVGAVITDPSAGVCEPMAGGRAPPDWSQLMATVLDTAGMPSRSA